MKIIPEVIQLGFDSPKLCECGCGQPVRHRFVSGHNGHKGSVTERFWSKVDKTSSPIGCWLWTRAKASGGYGKFGITKALGTVRAHRFAYELTHGPIADDLCVLHKCDVRACVNPDHLFLGTRADNAHDMVVKGRHVQLDWRGTRNGRARLTEDQVREIRKLRQDGHTTIELAARFGVTNSNISAICAGKLWKHIR